MSSRTYYTAVGHFRRRINGLGRSCPVIIINEQEYNVDIQEMALWTTLNWRLLDFPQVEEEYNKLNQDCTIPALRTLENCLGRLCTRGLVASGTGRTDFEALYDLLGGLYVSPLSENLLRRLAALFAFHSSVSDRLSAGLHIYQEDDILRTELLQGGSGYDNQAVHCAVQRIFADLAFSP